MMNVWRHKKTGGLYVILHTDIRIEKDWQRAVLYQSLNTSQRIARPFSEFYDGRFERLNKMMRVGEETRLSHDESF